MGALRTGGQGSVYKAKRRGEIITAVKLLPTPIQSETADDKHFAAFQNEVAKLKKVNELPNPNVVTILSSGITDTGNFPFIEMEYIDGPDLEDLLKPPHDPVFTIKETIKLAEHLSSALAHSHKVDVKHGDVKSNNVKYSAHTGNYILLDYGMAVMSDEQRRTSLRHAGAIEFMAPEQNEGQMLFQTDVYSFGVVLFELLAGTVPFPLHEKGETARNQVMVAHMETPVPDLLALRWQHLPASWSEEKKNREMQVPEWLLKMIFKCLEKDPARRFVNGIDLNNYVLTHLGSPATSNKFATDVLNRLQEENEKLRKEKAALEAAVFQYQKQSASGTLPPARSRSNPLWWILPLLIAGVVAWLVFFNDKEPNTQQANIENSKEPVRPRTSIGQYKVMASRAYFHNEPNQAARRNAWLIPSNDVITALDERNGYIYTEFTNNKGQTSKGWVRKSDLISLEEWSRRDSADQQAAKMKQDDIDAQLKDARQLLTNSEYREALYIYDYLAQQGVPEAMYQWGNLALQKKNDALDCDQGLAWVQKASDKGYAPAKRTLGFLYLFADSPEVLQMNDYEQCPQQRDVFRGSKLLLEAMAAGDSTAKRLMDQFNVTVTDSVRVQ
jgi:serine/threonine-protein kinase